MTPQMTDTKMIHQLLQDPELTLTSVASPLRPPVSICEVFEDTLRHFLAEEFTLTADEGDVERLKVEASSTVVVEV